MLLFFHLTHFFCILYRSLKFFFVGLLVIFSQLVLAEENNSEKVAPKVYEYVLENGLKVLVKPIFRAPVVSSQLWYKVGASYEYSGISGISHMLEHMMFKGTKKYPGNAFSSIVAKKGGNQNAFTSRDFTAYYQNVSKQHLSTMLELEADRMQGIQWDEQDFANEVRVVMEERRLRTDDSPNNRLYETFFVNSFSVNPYRIPVIGWMNDIENYEMQDAQKWFDQWYVPNNAILVVVGAVEPENVRQLAEKYFAHIPAGKIPTIKPRIEPLSTAEKRSVMKADVNYSFMMIGYRVPSFAVIAKQNGDKRDAFTLEVISALLDSGDSSRLPVELITRQRVASQSGAFYYPYSRLETMFVLDGITAEGKSAKELEKALLQQVELLKTELVSVEELEKVQNQIKANDVYQKDSLFYQGYALGALEAIGLGWQEGENYLQGVDSVTVEDILRVSKKYFVEKNRAVAVLQPQTGGK
jgi:zinc protease